MKIHLQDTFAVFGALFILFATVLQPVLSLMVAVALVVLLGVIENQALKARSR